MKIITRKHSTDNFCNVLILAFRFCFLMLILLPVTAQTNRWSYVGTNVAGAVFYLDLATIERSKNSVRLWDKTIFPDGSYQINLSQWQCDRRKSIIITSNIYEPSGNIIEIRKGGNWLDVTPNSISEAFYRRVCQAENSRSPNYEDSDEITEVRVKTIQANIRNLPMMDAAVVGKVRKGERLRLVNSLSSQGWYQIYFGSDDETAWIHGNTIEIIQPAGKKYFPDKRTKLPKSISDIPAVDN